MKKSEENPKGTDDNSGREIPRTATLGMFPPTRWPFVKRPKPPKSKPPKQQPK